MTTPRLKRLFRTDAQGDAASFLDVISDGLDGALEERIPELLALLHGPEGAPSLKAAVMLLTWGHPDAFRALKSWGSQPDSAPWASPSITHQRHSGADGSWSLIADALRTSKYATARPGLDADRLCALRILLHRSIHEDFDRSLATAIASIPGAAEHLADALDAAIEGLRSSGLAGHDRIFQAALLAKELARTRPERAQVLAQQLSAQAPSPRAQRELRDLL